MPNDAQTRLASMLIDLRRARTDLFPKDLFSDPAWDLLLELFVADAFGRRSTGREVCELHDIPPKVMSRWLIVLTQYELMVGDGDGRLDDLLTLSPKAMAKIEQLLGGVLSELTSLTDNKQEP